MATPEPRTGELKEDFMQRCMSDEEMQEEFQDTDKRIAVCLVSWKKDLIGKIESLRKNEVE
jgi:hypothetical protein